MCYNLLWTFQSSNCPELGQWRIEVIILNCFRLFQAILGLPKISSQVFFFSCFLKLYYYFLFIFGRAGSSLPHRGFLQSSEWGLLFVVAYHGSLVVAASPVAGQRLWDYWLQQLWHMGSVLAPPGLSSADPLVVLHGLSCCAACGIFPDQGSNPCPQHQQADSSPLCPPQRAGTTLQLSALASHHSGFSCCRASALRCAGVSSCSTLGSVITASGLQSIGSVVVGTGLVALWRVGSSWIRG